MGGFFNMDSKLMVFLSRITDLIILNVIFVATCIPFITIGAAITSLYEVTLKMAKDEESYIIKGYLKAFKSNFKKSTVMWIVTVIAFTILGLDLYISFVNVGTIWDVLLAMSFVFMVVLVCIVSYLYPLLAKFENTYKNTFINAWFMAIKHFPTTIYIVICNSVFVVCLLYNSYTFYYGILVYLITGFAVIAYMNSILLVRVFEKYINTDEIEKAEQE